MAGLSAVTTPLLVASGNAEAASTPINLSTPLGRLKAFMTGVIGGPTVSLSVTQGASNLGDPIDTGSIIYPAPAGYGSNPNPGNLANIPQIWGHRRDTWSLQQSRYVASAAQNSSWYTPVFIIHTQASSANNIPTGMHFIHTGQAFEILFIGNSVQVTLIADGQYCSTNFINSTLTSGKPGALLSAYNTFTKFDFGSIATRRVSVYGYSTLGPCTIAVSPQDTIGPWDRSYEPSCCAMTDSYGAGYSNNWYLGGPFWEAFSLLGIPHIDLNCMGGTGYAPNAGHPYTMLPGNTFQARIPDTVTSAPDLFLTAGGINDPYDSPQPGLYDTGAAALIAFQTGVFSYFQQLRAALPNSVLAAIGPWAPVQSIPTNPVAQGKLNIIQAGLESVAGPWVFIDNLNGGWFNSSGASGPSTGPWQTGTGNVAHPTGDGNGDIYVSADGTHPTVAGNMYLGRMLASNLAAGILAL
jgi:lysophospholipase L1-like esterase